MDVAVEDAAVARTDIHRGDHVRVESKKGDGPGFHGRVVHFPEDGDHPKLPAGTFGVIGVDGRLKAAEPGDITVVDRSYWKDGDIVLSGGRVGIVTGVDTVLDLVKLGGTEPAAALVMSGASPDSLRRVRELCLGDFVVSGMWLGRVVEVSLSFTVAFDDGAVCKVIGDERSEKLRPVTTRGRYYQVQTNTIFYPGQRVTGPADMFKGCRWLHGYWKPCREVGTISKVEMAGVSVFWAASLDAARMAPDPPAYQHPNNLTFFCSSMQSYWGIGDRCFVRDQGKKHRHGCSSPSDDVDYSSQKLEQPSSSAGAAGEKRLSSRKRCFLRARQRRPRRGQRREVEQPMSVANTSTTVDVLWQDGTRQCGAPSTSLTPYAITGEHEFFPGFYVVDKATATGAIDDEASGQKSGRVGVVRSVSFEDQTVGVSWFKDASSPDEGREEDTVSAYDLALRRDNFVYHGSVVAREPPASGCSQARSATAAADLSWVGRVVDLRDGRVQVRWGDGSTSMVLPHEITPVLEHNYWDLPALMGLDDSSDDDDSEEDDDPEEEEDLANNTHPPKHNNVEGENDLVDEADHDSVDEDGTAATRASRLGAIVQPVLRLAVQVLTQATSYFPGRLSSSSSLGSELDAPTANVGTRPALVTDGHDDTSNGDAAAAATSDDAAVDDTNDGDAIHATATAATSDDDDADVDDGDSAEKGKSTVEATGFPHFDVTQSPPDHHYLDNVDQGSNGGKKWVKAVQKEWKILKNNVPDTIYIRAFEDRMDLVRAVMVGASGTPYQDGLFFFDLHLPPTYPDVPPLVYYHSFGLKLNPNLYDSGTVCLSLLGTFGGEGSEEWLPGTSTLLQVVVSIQGLILNNQPFFNEAGYEALVSRPEGHRNALPYSENAYLLTLQSMLHLLRRPPRGFEEFVRDHFHRRGRFMLRACDAYLRGCIVGTLDSDARATEGSMEEGRPCSAGLRLALAKVVPRLLAVFAEVGAEGCDCDQFHGLLDMLVDGPPSAR